jgi:hypothetical protein
MSKQTSTTTLPVPGEVGRDLYVVNWRHGPGKKGWLYDFVRAAGPDAALRKKMEELKANGVTDAEGRAFYLSRAVDGLQAMMEEIAEGVELLRPHYPEADERELGFRAQTLKNEKHRRGSWPDAEELAARAASEREAEERERQRQAELAEPEAPENVDPPPEASDAS